MRDPRLNIPNALATFRLVGSFVLVPLALAGASTYFAGLLLALLLSDWIDGKLAILLDQRTTFGARLDSVADTLMYAALLFGMWWLKWDFIERHGLWIAAVVFTYAVTTVFGLIKYRRVPSYHTRGAKTSWLLVGIAAFVIFADGPAWVFKLAMVAVMLTNTEATLMTLVLPCWRADVPSLWHAWRLRHEPPAAPTSPTADECVDEQGEQAQEYESQH